MVLFGCATLVVDVLTPAAQRRTFLAWFNGAGLLLVGYSLIRQWQQLSANPGASLTALQGTVAIDGLALFTNTLVLFATAALLLISYRYLEIVNEHRGEYYALALLAQC